MIDVKIDMTGWIMSEHGVPDSLLTVIQQTEDCVRQNGKRYAQWLCECSCKEHNKIIVLGTSVRSGSTKSCGCIRKETAAKQNKKENIIDLSGEYGIIYASNTNAAIYFDLEDAKELLKYSWYVDVHGYATTMINNTPTRMHVILGKPKHDHHNRNKLDNRKANLVRCTHTENMQNRSRGKNNTSGFIGVGWDKKSSQWYARICVNKNRIHLGFFTNKRHAIIARLYAEQKYFGEFAPQRHLFEEYGIKDGENID